MDTFQSLKHRNFYKPLVRSLFWIGLGVIFYFAFSPDADIGPDFDQSDKLKHALAFGVLALLLQESYLFMIPIAISILFGIGLFIETVQWFLPYRDASFWDLIADGVGVALGLWLRQWLQKAEKT